MKILFISDLWVPFPGGAERYIANVANELQKRGHQITALTSYDKARDERIPVILKNIGVKDRHAEGLQILDTEIRRLQPDLIVTAHFFAYEFGAELVKYPLPVVQLIYNRSRLPEAKLAVYISQHTFNTSGGLPGDMVIHPPAYQDIVALTHGEKIGFVKPIHHKGVDYVYRLAEFLPHRQFLILRGEWPTVEDIRELPNVEFMASVYDIREFYAQCKILLMPSWSEDAGTIPQEAAMNGLPCISTDIMGLTETNIAGIKLELNELLWRAEIEALYNDPSYYQFIVNRQTAQLVVFNWDQKFDQLSDRLNEICNV